MRGFAATAILATISLGLALIFGVWFLLPKPPFVLTQLFQKNLPTPTLAPPSPTPTPDETADWERIETKCGFSMKHPKGWRVTHKDPGCPYLEGPDFKKQSFAESYGPFLRFSRTQLGKNISILSHGKPQEVAVDSLQGQIKAWELADGNEISNVRDKSYGSLRGQEFTLKNKSENRFYTTFMFLHDIHVYIIEWPNKYVDQYGPDIEKMVSSVKFL